jgi:hypothetical protein
MEIVDEMREIDSKMDHLMIWILRRRNGINIRWILDHLRRNIVRPF